MPPLRVPLPENSSSLKTFLRYIPEELGNCGGGGNRGQEVKSQQGMECKCTGSKEFGVHREYSQSRYPQRELQKDRELQRGTKGERKLKTESECKRAGGVTLSLLPNLASESVTAEREGRVVGETDISGLRLLEAHLGLDWAAEGLDLTSPSTTLPHLHPDPCIFILPRCTPAYAESSFPQSYLHSLYLHIISNTQPYTDPSQPRHLPMDSTPRTQLGRTNTPLSASTQHSAPTPLLSLYRHSPSIHPVSIFEGVLWEGLGPNSQWRVSPSLCPQWAPGQQSG